MAVPSDLCSFLAGMERVSIADPAEQSAFGKCIGQVVSATAEVTDKPSTFLLMPAGISPVMSCRLYC